MNLAHLSISRAAAAGQHKTGGACLVQSVQAEERLHVLCIWTPALNQYGPQLFHRPQLVQDLAALESHTQNCRCHVLEQRKRSILHNNCTRKMGNKLT